MPAHETAWRTQTAVLWEPSGTDGYGQATFASPVEVDVRWKYANTEMVGADGKPVAIDATVVVAQEVPVNSRMWLGSLSEWLGTGSGDSAEPLMRVLTYRYTPDIKGRNFRRTLGLGFERHPGG